MFTDSNSDVFQMAWEVLSAVTKTLDSSQQTTHVRDIRPAVRFAVSDLKGHDLLLGFCLPKGIMPILPIFREAILNGLPEIKEQAAQGLGEVIKLTSAQALQPSVVHITGPLIRILGDRFKWNVKAAVLESPVLLLAKVERERERERGERDIMDNSYAVHSSCLPRHVGGPADGMRLLP